MKHIYQTRIKEQYLDGLGHMNNAAYLVLFEEARWDVLRCHGLTLENILKDKIGPVILDLSLRFLKEAKNQDDITIHSWSLGKKGRLIFHYAQEMIRLRDGQVLATIQLTVGIMDLEKRRLMAPPPTWDQSLGQEEPTNNGVSGNAT